MATYTAGDQINRALRLIGVLAEGETPSANTSADALVALNQMLDSWSTESLAVYSTMTQNFPWPSGQASRTIGPTGQLVGTRPILLDDATYYKYGGVSYPIEIVNQEQYNSIALKSVSSVFPQVLFVDTAYPDATIYLWPVPSAALDFYFVSAYPLTEATSLSTTLVFPPGYMRAFAYNLACELAPEFGVEPSPTVRRIALSSKRDLKRINAPDDLMSFPGAILNNSPPYNIYVNNY